MSEVNWDKIESRSDTSAKSCAGCLGEYNSEVCRKLPRCTIGEGCHHVIWVDKVPKGTPQEVIDGTNTITGLDTGRIKRKLQLAREGRYTAPNHRAGVPIHDMDDPALDITTYAGVAS